MHAILKGDKKPPKASPAFCVPAPPKLLLAVIKAPPADHDDALTASYANPTLPDTPKPPLI